MEKLYSITLRTFGDYDGKFNNLRMSAVDLLHKYCDCFAMTLAIRLKCDCRNVKIVKSTTDILSEAYIHEYCIAETVTGKVYIDVRGIFKDYKTFISELINYEHEVHNININYEDLKEIDVFDIRSTPDEICDVLINQFGCGFNETTAYKLSEKIVNKYYNNYAIIN